METVGAYQAKTHLPKLLERVSRGESIKITKHGVPIAMLKPIDDAKQSNAEDVIAEILQFRAANKPLGDLSIKEMIDEGRR